MSANKAFTFKFKNNADTYIPLYPKINGEKIIGWQSGEVIGPIDLTLRADAWQAKRQSFKLLALKEDDNVNCSVVLAGSVDQMKRIQEEYNKLKAVYAYDDVIEFEYMEKPTMDITVQVWWVR